MSGRWERYWRWSRMGAASAALAYTGGATAQNGAPLVLVAVPVARLAGSARIKAAESVAQVRIVDAHPEQLAARQVDPVRVQPKLKVDDGAATLNVKKGDQIVVQRPGPAATPLTLQAKTKQPLASTVIVGVTDSNEEVTAKQLQPFMQPEVSPLRWDATTQAYTMTLIVGLDPVWGEPSSQPVALVPPILFQITGENVDGISPAQVAVSLAGPSGYQQIQVLTRSYRVPIKVSAHSSAGDGSFNANVDPGPAWFDVAKSDAAVDGLGLGKTTISVRQRAANGDLWATADALHVALKTTSGALTPPYVDIAAHHSEAETTLVSSAWGVAIVTEASDAGGVHSARVDFTFPWLKLLLGLTGAAAAGGIRVLNAVRSKQAWLAVFVGCIASGVVIDILLALGAPLAPAALADLFHSELAWLAIGLVAGFPGTAALEWAGGKLFGFRKPAAEEARS